jgi:hypothetical protein
VGQQTVAKFIAINAMSMVTPEAAAKYELLFDRPLRDGLVEHLSMTQAGKQSVTKFMAINYMSLVTLEAKLLFGNPASEVGI